MSDDANDPRSSNYWFGRLEGKLDKMDEKLDHQGETLAGHGERIVAVERDIRDLKQARANDDTGNTTVRAAVVGGVTSALVGGGFVLLQLITHH